MTFSEEDDEDDKLTISQLGTLVTPPGKIKKRNGLWFSRWIYLRYTKITDSKKNYNKIIEHISLWKLSQQHMLHPDEWCQYCNHMTYLHDMEPEKCSLTPLIFK